MTWISRFYTYRRLTPENLLNCSWVMQLLVGQRIRLRNQVWALNENLGVLGRACLSPPTKLHIRTSKGPDFVTHRIAAERISLESFVVAHDVTEGTICTVQQQGFGLTYYFQFPS